MAGFALLGCSHPHSAWHLDTLRLLPEIGSIWLWDTDLGAAREMGTAAGERCGGASDDLETLLKHREVEFVLVACRNDETPDIVARAARAGKQILCEKPMAVSPSALAPALAEVQAAGVTAAVYYPWRAHPAVRDLREIVAAGLLGRIVGVEARVVTSQPRFRDPGAWLFDPATAGGGILAWLGCHVLDLIRYLLQEEVTEVSALAGAVCEPSLRVEDTAALAMRFSGGAIGTLTAGYHLARSVPGYRGATFDTALAVRGTEGRFTWEPLARDPVVRLESVRPEWAGAPEREIRYRLDPSEAYGGRHGVEFVRQFIAAARSGSAPPASAADALAVLRILAAAYDSAATGRRTAVSGPDSES